MLLPKRKFSIEVVELTWLSREKKRGGLDSRNLVTMMQLQLSNRFYKKALQLGVGCVCAQKRLTTPHHPVPWTAAARLLCPWILQARVLEWVAMPSSRGSSWPRDETHVSYVSCTGRQVLYLVTWEALLWVGLISLINTGVYFVQWIKLSSCCKFYIPQSFTIWSHIWIQIKDFASHPELWWSLGQK